ncbi:MAG: hypothetical protein ACRDY3_02410, partial [Acidimicrobiales bacterium]
MSRLWPAAVPPATRPIPRLLPGAAARTTVDCVRSGTGSTRVAALPEARSACAPWVSRWAEVAEGAAARSVALPGEMVVVVAA